MKRIADCLCGAVLLALLAAATSCANVINDAVGTSDDGETGYDGSSGGSASGSSSTANAYNDGSYDDGAADLTVYSGLTNSYETYKGVWLTPSSSKYYTFLVESGGTYYIQWIDTGANASLFTGNGLATGDGKFSVYTASSEPVSLFRPGSETPRTENDSSPVTYFTADEGGFYQLKVQQQYSSSSESYYVGIRVSHSLAGGDTDAALGASNPSNTVSEYDVVYVESGSTSKIHTYQLEAGTTYYIQWIDSGSNPSILTSNGYATGDATFSVYDPKMASVSLSVQGSSSTITSNDSSPLTYFQPAESETFSIVIRPYSSYMDSGFYVGIRMYSLN